MKEKFIQTGEKIVKQIKLEKTKKSVDNNIGYIEGIWNSKKLDRWILRDKRTSFSYTYDINGNVSGTTSDGQNNTIYPASSSILRDSIAGKIIYGGVGKHEYKAPGGLMKAHVQIISTYTNRNIDGGDALDGLILIDGSAIEFKFASLIEELNKLRNLEQETEEKKKELKAAQIDSEEAIKLRDEIQKKEEEISELKLKVRKHIAQEVALRDRPILDKYQDEVRRSKILDGNLIINGGPGTGKTTSLIQRIKFLTSPTILEETGPLSEEKTSILFDQNRSWIFYSPTDLLRTYLANAMNAEGLAADSQKVRTWDSHRKQLLRETGLINPETQRPFISKNNKNGKVYFNQSMEVIKLINDSFTEEFLNKQSIKIKRIHDKNHFKKLLKPIDQKVADDHREEILKVAAKMQDHSSRALNYTKIDELIPFFISFQEEFQDYLRTFNKKLTEEIGKEAALLQLKISKEQDLIDWLNSLIIEELKNKVNQEVDEEEDDLEDEDETPIDINQTIDLKRALDRKLRTLLRSISIRTIDAGNNSLSTKNKVLFEKVEKFLNPEKLVSIGIRLFFKKNYEKPAKGLESNLLSEIPITYKKFRRTFLKGESFCLTESGLIDCEQAIKAHNKPLNNEEADYLLSVIFGICQTLFKTRKQYFEKSEHPYVLAFVQNIKGVVAIDEATDFSLWELNAMTQLAHPFFNSVTLCGDLMQRMTERGLTSWKDYTDINKNTEIRDLKIAYRQTAKLLDIASEIYSWNVNAPAEFVSQYDHDPLDPDPLICISENESVKLDWLVERIMEIQNLYGNTFPTVAIFVKDDTEVLRISKLLKQYDQLEGAGLDVSPCVQGQILGDKQNIRLFSVEYIKGLEFGAVFFLDLDDLPDNSDELMNKYIYVGLSRANLFLGVTMNIDFSEGLKYLEPMFNKGNWKDINNS